MRCNIDGVWFYLGPYRTLASLGGLAPVRVDMRRMTGCGLAWCWPPISDVWAPPAGAVSGPRDLAPGWGSEHDLLTTYQSGLQPKSESGSPCLSVIWPRLSTAKTACKGQAAPRGRRIRGNNARGRPAGTPAGEVRGGTTQGEGRVPTSAESWRPEAPRLPPAPGRTIPPNPLLNADRVAMA